MARSLCGLILDALNISMLLLQLEKAKEAIYYSAQGIMKLLLSIMNTRGIACYRYPKDGFSVNLRAYWIVVVFELIVNRKCQLLSRCDEVAVTGARISRTIP